MASIELSGGEALDARLAEIGRKLGTGRITARVGFLDSATYPDGTNVATVAAVQNFGAPAMGIPPRPFFSNMIEAKSPRWGESLSNILQANNLDVRLSLEQMGAGIAGQLRQSIRDTNEPPLAPATIERKGFDKPLIDSGVMFQSVDHEVVDGDGE